MINHACLFLAETQNRKQGKCIEKVPHMLHQQRRVNKFGPTILHFLNWSRDPVNTSCCKNYSTVLAPQNRRCAFQQNWSPFVVLVTDGKLNLSSSLSKHPEYSWRYCQNNMMFDIVAQTPLTIISAWVQDIFINRNWIQRHIRSRYCRTPTNQCLAITYGKRISIRVIRYHCSISARVAQSLWKWFTTSAKQFEQTNI